MENKSFPAQQKYLPNLDGLRFIGAMLILVLHVEDMKVRHGRAAIPVIRYFHPTGEMVVSLFFVLSGFLITYLLIKEKNETGDINLKGYYLRRTMRIWPLYYLIVILGFFVFPYLDVYFNGNYSENIYSHFWLYFAGCLLFLSPFVRTSIGIPQTIGPIWSIGVEEAFYICWPVFLKKSKNYLKLFLILIIGIVVLRNIFLLCEPLFNTSKFGQTVFVYARSLIIQYRITCMAIGGIGAYLVVNNNSKFLSFIFRKDVQVGIYLLTIGLLVARIGLKRIGLETFPSLNYEWYSVLFCCIITNLAANPKSIIRLDFSWMNYLGKVSYGLYMYSPVMRIISMGIVEKMFGKEVSGWQMNVLLYAFTIILTIITAIISYHLFEKRFLNLGRRLSKPQAV